MAGTVGLLLLGLVCYLAFIEAWWLPLVPSALAFGIAATGVTASLSRQESMQRALLMQLFSKYVSRDFAEAIWQQREQFAVGGCPRPQQLVATVLFVDLRGFTAVSEKLEPQALIPWLNAFIDSMARLVMRHGGVAHQFIGDAVMAVFGVPLARTTRAEIAQDAANAVQCALAMTRQVDCLNARWREQGLPAMGIRIGICTGAVVVGSLGSEERLAYMVIGDTVNTASRLQSLDCSACPATSGRILIGESTLAYLEGQFTTQCIGAMRLKGKDKEISIYRVTGRGMGMQQVTLGRTTVSLSHRNAPVQRLRRPVPCSRLSPSTPMSPIQGRLTQSFNQTLRPLPAVSGGVEGVGGSDVP
jgi:adenylate cyclase